MCAVRVALQGHRAWRRCPAFMCDVLHMPAGGAADLSESNLSASSFTPGRIRPGAAPSRAMIHMALLGVQQCMPPVLHVGTATVHLYCLLLQAVRVRLGLLPHHHQFFKGNYGRQFHHVQLPAGRARTNSAGDSGLVAEEGGTSRSGGSLCHALLPDSESQAVAQAMLLCWSSKTDAACCRHNK